MSFPEFGTIVQQSTNPNFEQFGEIVQEPSRARSIASAAPKGALKGLSELARSLKIYGIQGVPEEQLNPVLEKILPTQNKQPEQFLKRAGKVGSYVAGGEGSLAAKVGQTLLGAAGGEIAKKFGGGELAQNLAETGGILSPNIAKKIPLKKAQEMIGSFARKHGFTEHELAPILKSEQQLDKWATLAAKGAKTKDLMQSINQKSGAIYQEIDKRAAQTAPLGGQDLDDFLGNIQDVVNKVRPRFQRLIQNDLNDLLNSPMGFNDIKDFYQDINATVKGAEGGKAVLNLFKEPVNKALHKIDTGLATDFSLANDLYRKQANVRYRLNPKEIESLMSAGEDFALMTSIATGDLGLLQKVLGVAGGRLFAREMIINPRLQNLGERLMISLKENRFPAALKLKNDIEKEIKRKNPGLAEEMANFEAKQESTFQGQ